MGKDERDINYLVKKSQILQIEKREENVYQQILALGSVFGKGGKGLYRKWLKRQDQLKKTVLGEEGGITANFSEEERKQYFDDMLKIQAEQKKLDQILENNRKKKEAMREKRRQEREQKNKMVKRNGS